MLNNILIPKVKNKRKVSKLASLSLHAIIESGPAPDQGIETVKKIADALGVSIDDLLKNK